MEVDTLLSLGNGSWAAASDTEFGGTGEDDGPGWRVADVNGDRFDDLVHVHFDGSATEVVRTLLSQGDGHWTPAAEPLKLPSTDTADWKPGPFTPDGKTLVLTLGAPIKEPKKVLAALTEMLLTNLKSGVEGVERKNTLLGNRVRFLLADGLSLHSKLIGFVFSGDPAAWLSAHRYHCRFD